jgi:hypothetical protein
MANNGVVAATAEHARGSSDQLVGYLLQAFAGSAADELPPPATRGPQVPHGTLTRWLEGCDCDQYRDAQNTAARARFRRKAQ